LRITIFLECGGSTPLSFFLRRRELERLSVAKA
jgi:hypothetical protein